MQSINLYVPNTHTFNELFSTNSKVEKMQQNLKRDFSTETIHIAK